MYSIDNNLDNLNSNCRKNTEAEPAATDNIAGAPDKKIVIKLLSNSYEPLPWSWKRKTMMFSMACWSWLTVA